MTCTDLNMSVLCRNVKSQHFSLVPEFKLHMYHVGMESLTGGWGLMICQLSSCTFIYISTVQSLLYMLQ